VRVELLDEPVLVEGVPRRLVVVPEGLVVEMELGLTLGLVAAETSVDLHGVGGLEHAKDGVEHEDESMDIFIAE